MKNNFDLVTNARLFAAGAHSGHCYGTRPYLEHLDAVADVLKRLGVNELLPNDFAPGFTHRQMLAAAYLHDTLEDTHVTAADLEQFFGEGVRQLVKAVTDPPGFASRKERKRFSLAETRKLSGAVALKLADRIANVEAGLSCKGRDHKLAMYLKEYESFRETLWRAGEWPEFWYRLTSLMAQAKLRVSSERRAA